MIAGHDQCAEAESPATLHYLGATVDKHDFLGRVALRCGSFVGVAVLSPALIWLCHDLKLQSSGARCVGQSFYFSVILKSAAIEHDGVGLFRQQTFRNSFSNELGGSAIRRRLGFA